MIRLTRVLFEHTKTSEFICSDCVDMIDDFFTPSERPTVFEDDTIIDRECPVCHKCDE